MDYQIAKAIAYTLSRAKDDHRLGLRQIEEARRVIADREAAIPKLEALIAECEAMLGADTERLLQEIHATESSHVRA